MLLLTFLALTNEASQPSFLQITPPCYLSIFLSSSLNEGQGHPWESYSYRYRSYLQEGYRLAKSCLFLQSYPAVCQQIDRQFVLLVGRR